MPVTIGKQVEPVHKSKYVVEVKCMHGDGDAYSTDEVIILKSRPDYVEDLVMTLKQMEALPWNDHREGYRKLDQWRKWFTENYVESEWLEDFHDEGNSAMIWPGDATCDHQILARLKSWELFFYDEDGTKYYASISEK